MGNYLHAGRHLFKETGKMETAPKQKRKMMTPWHNLRLHLPVLHRTPGKPKLGQPKKDILALKNFGEILVGGVFKNSLDFAFANISVFLFQSHHL